MTFHLGRRAHVGTRHAIRRSHGFYLPRSIHRLNYSSIQSFRCHPVITPLIPTLPIAATEGDKVEVASRPYRGPVGALAWAALGTWPDIAFATGSLACYAYSAGRVH